MHYEMAKEYQLKKYRCKICGAESSWNLKAHGRTYHNDENVTEENYKVSFDIFSYLFH